MKQAHNEEPVRRPVILGFDPGTQVTGWGVVTIGRRPKLSNYGVIRTPRGEPMEVRLNVIFEDAETLIRTYQPTVVAVEDPFVGKSVASALALGQARGVLLVAAARAGLEVASYSPRSVKSSVVGRGGATKEQVQFMIQKLLGLDEPPKPADASDALAVALCHVHRMQYALQVNRQVKR